MMDIKFDNEKLLASAKDKIKYLPAFIITLIVIAFGILTYIALFPGQNSALVEKGEKRVSALDIRFDTKLLKELGSTKPSVELGTAGGRDPFSGF
jgi:hypothetical protein